MLTSKFVIAGLLGCCLLASAAANAETRRELTWEDLLPERLLELEKQAMKLKAEHRNKGSDWRKALRRVAEELNLRDQIKQGTKELATLRDRDREILEAKASEQFPQAKAYWESITRLREQAEKASSEVNATLDGTEVRIPGYVLPLEFSGELVAEFLLVPFVGACIHVPPPPPNQIVFVRAKEAFKSDGVFAPVWVEGEMSTQSGSFDLTRVDGSAEVPVGYSLEASQVLPYER